MKTKTIFSFLLCLIFKPSLCQTNLIQNGDFSGLSANWTVSGPMYISNSFSCYSSATSYAYVGDASGFAINNASAFLYQIVTIPSGATSADLYYDISINTDEAPTGVYDYMSVYLADFSWNAISQINTHSNMTGNTPSSGCQSYQSYSLSIPSSLFGQTFYVVFYGQTDGSNLSKLRIDDVSLIVNTSSCSPVTVISHPQNQTANVGGAVTFSVGTNASATSPISYMWYENGVAQFGSNNPTFTTSTLTTSDNGNIYYCDVSNCGGSNQSTSNAATLTINQGSSLSDLIISNLNIAGSNSSIVAGSSLLVNFDVKNLGNSAAPNTYTSFHLSQDASFQSGVDQFLNDTLTGPVGAFGASVHFSNVSIKIPSGTPPGTWYILISADGTLSTTESDEGNNTNFIQINVADCYDQTLDYYQSEAQYIGSGDPAYSDCMNSIFNNSYDIDNWSFYKYQCVSYVAFMVNKSWGYNFPNKSFENNMTGTVSSAGYPCNFNVLNGTLSDACHWDERLGQNNGKNFHFLMDKTPAVGSIAFWNQCNNCAVGHVAFVNCVSSPYITITEYNFGTKCGFGSRTILASQVDTFIHTEISGGIGGYIGFSDLLGSSNNLNVYPNPTMGKFILSLENYHSSPAKITILNSVGQTIYEEFVKDLIEKEVDLSTCSFGVYYIVVQTHENIFQKKVILHN